MARLQGISGGMSGKTGSFTFRQSGGRTIVSQYQPIVKNPNSAGQQAQRAKFKLMSQLAAIMEEALGTIGINERPARGKMSQRNAFIAHNFDLVTTGKDLEGNVVAKIPMDRLKLTTSFRPLPELQMKGLGKLLVEMTNISSDVTTVRVVIIGYDNGQAFIANIIDVPVKAGKFEYEDNTVQKGNYTILAYGLIPSESAKSSIDIDNIHTPADEEFISSVKLAVMVASGNMVETMTVGGNVAVTAN